MHVLFPLIAHVTSGKLFVLLAADGDSNGDGEVDGKDDDRIIRVE